MLQHRVNVLEVQEQGRNLKHVLRKAGGGQHLDPAGQKVAAEYARQLTDNISNDKFLILRGQYRKARWNSHGQMGRQESKLGATNESGHHAET